MADINQSSEKRLKDSESARLSEDIDLLIVRYGRLLSDTDDRLEVYLKEVAGNPSGHNLYEILAVRRFFDMLGIYGWDAARVRRFLRFYEILRFNGISGRCRYRLTPVQCFQFANIFGFSREDGGRLIRTAYIFVPRKFSKTTSAASLAVWDMFFGDNNAQAYIGANSYEQAKICFDEIRNIIRDIDPSERHFKVNREKITFKDRGRESFIRCLTANAKTQDGLNASLVIMDEYAQARNTSTKNGADLKNVLTTSMGARREPLTVIITTASEVIDGPFVHELEGVKAVLRGETKSDTMFASLFMPDADDDESNPATWAKVQPHIGITVQPDYYEREWANAQLSSENMMTFRTKLLNVFAKNEEKEWFSYDKAKSLCGDFNIDRVTGKPMCTVAFDLSVHEDFSAVSYTFYSGSTGKFYSHTDYYLPEGTLPGHPNEALYREWVRSGHLILCKGDCIDSMQVAGDIIRRSERLNIVRIGYDRYKAQELVAILSSSHGGPETLTPYAQTIGNFNLPVESFEMMAYSDPPRIILNDNPINAFCLSNAVLVEDALENKKPMKPSKYRKIDGAITILMTLGLIYEIER